MLALYFLSSTILGSAMARAISNFLVYEKGLNLFRAPNIPALSPELALVKTFDLVDFGLALGFSLAYFLFLKYIFKPKNQLVVISTLIFNFILFMQIHFASYNLLRVLLFLGAFQLIFVITNRSKIKLRVFSKLGTREFLRLANGILAGFWLMLVINNYTTTILPLCALLLTPIAYLTIPFERGSRLGHLILIFSIFNPGSPIWLAGVGAISLFFILIIKKPSEFVLRVLYPAVFVILTVYNPLYNFGRFDPVEEGFWLGWLAGIGEGRILYKEIAAYHPPLIVWFLALFQNVRLGLHALQVAGVIFYYFLVRKLLKTRFSVFMVMLAMLSFTSIFVRNNIEIRLGLGLLSFALFSRPYLAGVVAGLSLFSSVEVGISAIVAGVVGFLLFERKKLWSYFVGLATVFALICAYLVWRGSLASMMGQLGFYATAFSEGYLNLPIERSVNTAFIHWHIVNQYISAYPFLWELARGALLGGLLAGYYTKNKLAVSLSIFGLILFRTALGRSDIYHLLFPLLLAIPLVYFSLEKLKIRGLTLVFSVFMVAVFARNIVNASFVENKLYSLQTYGKALEEEQFLSNSETEVIDFIREHTEERQAIFVYPWNPEIYYFTQRPNATKYFTPYAFFNEEQQREMIDQLAAAGRTLVVYNPEMKFGNLTTDSLALTNRYIMENFAEEKAFGDYKIMWPKKLLVDKD